MIFQVACRGALVVVQQLGAEASLKVDPPLGRSARTLSLLLTVPLTTAPIRSFNP